MTMWELTACIDGFNEANTVQDQFAPPTDEEFEKMLEAYDHFHATRQ